jgi:hypothetical protein
LSDTFSVINGLKCVDALLQSILNFAVEYVFTWVQAGRDGTKLNGTHQLLVYVDILLGESIHAIKENT